MTEAYANALLLLSIPEVVKKITSFTSTENS
jgi:hypothetical protein